jgi:hypothetical protein
VETKIVDIEAAEAEPAKTEGIIAVAPPKIPVETKFPASVLKLPCATCIWFASIRLVLKVFNTADAAVTDDTDAVCVLREAVFTDLIEPIPVDIVFAFIVLVYSMDTSVDCAVICCAFSVLTVARPL